MTLQSLAESAGPLLDIQHTAVSDLVCRGRLAATFRVRFVPLPTTMPFPSCPVPVMLAAVNAGACKQARGGRIRSLRAWVRTGVGAVLLAAAGLLLATAPASAATFKPTRTDDPNPGACKPKDCSLREAVRAANANPGADQIKLRSKGAYRLSRIGHSENLAATGDLDISGPLRIFYSSSKGGRAAIDGNTTDRIFEQLDPGAPLTIERLLLVRGLSPPFQQGGAILSNADLTIENSILRGNESLEQGGAVYTEPGADLRITDSKLNLNHSDDDSGAIEFTGETMVVKNSRFRQNTTDGQGGVAYLSPGESAKFVKTRVSGSHADNRAGAIYLNDGILRVVKSQFSGNTTPGRGGGIFSYGTLITKSSTYSNNTAEGAGGGIFIGGPSGGVNMLNSTVADNQSFADGGGIAFENNGAGAILSSTFARNHADSDQAGASGTGGGISINSSGPVMLRNSLLAANRQTAGRNDCIGPVNSLGNNVFSTLGPAGSCPAAGPNDLVQNNARIKQLGDYGGPTDTVALRGSSPAVGHAHKSSSPAKDQRGRKRDGSPDAGAFER